jgi:hypothetical protein
MKMIYKPINPPTEIFKTQLGSHKVELTGVTVDKWITAVEYRDVVDDTKGNRDYVDEDVLHLTTIPDEELLMTWWRFLKEYVPQMRQVEREKYKNHEF